MDQTDLLWALLIAQQLDAIKSLDPARIDFSRRHKDGRTLLVQASDLLLPNADMMIDEDQTKARLDCISRLVSWGASPLQPCSQCEFTYSVWKKGNKEGSKIKVDPSGLSAISYVEEWIKQFLDRQVEGVPELDWQNDIEAMGKVLVCFVPKAVRVPIHEGIVELWEKSLAAKQSHDLTFKTADGEVTAHAHMLKEASSVISAMLASPMKEGQAQSIEVKDASSSGVSLFLERLALPRPTFFLTGVCLCHFMLFCLHENLFKVNLSLVVCFAFGCHIATSLRILYTCSAQTMPDHTTALQALDLAHRWQVQVAVTILSDLLGRMITDESFVAIAEQAVLKARVSK